MSLPWHECKPSFDATYHIEADQMSLRVLVPSTRLGAGISGILMAGSMQRSREGNPISMSFGSP
jgi:hypothetical protein